MREEEEERNAGSLEDPQWRFQVECRGTMIFEGFKESEEANYIIILSNLGTYISAEIKKTYRNTCEIRLVHTQRFRITCI